VDQDEFNPQSWNLYNYTRNNPLRHADPTGRGFFEKLGNWLSGYGFRSNADVQAEEDKRRQEIRDFLKDPLNVIVNAQTGNSLTPNDVGGLKRAQIWQASNNIRNNDHQRISWEDYQNLAGIPGPIEVPPSVEKDLGKVFKKYPADSAKCDTAARKVLEAFEKKQIKGEIVEITDRYGTQVIYDAQGRMLSSTLETGGGTAFHQAVRVGDRYFDALTGPKGATLDEYIKLFHPDHVLQIVIKP